MRIRTRTRAPQDAPELWSAAIVQRLEVEVLRGAFIGPEVVLTDQRSPIRRRKVGLGLFRTDFLEWLRKWTDGARFGMLTHRNDSSLEIAGDGKEN